MGTRAKQDTGYLTGDQVVAAELAEEDVEVPEWGGKVRVRALKQGVITALYEEAGATPANGGMIEDVPAWQRLLVREGMIEPKLTKAQVEKLADQAAPPILRIARAVGDLSAVPVTFGPGDLGNA